VGTDRRTHIADAVIETLARAGSRGLTHRTVDDVAGLPRGSTSYYLRTRAALVAAAVDRLAELDATAVHALTGERPAEKLARVLDQLRSSDRDRSLARYELALEAVRRPEIGAALEAGRRQIRHALADQLADEGAADADDLAGDLMALFDGLLFRELTAPAARHPGREEFRRAFDRMLANSARRVARS